MKHLHTIHKKVFALLSKTSKKSPFIQKIPILLFKKHPAASFACICLLLLVGTFFITQDTHPHTSELAYTEYSQVSSHIGSVIPASCDSSSGYIDAHGGPDCPPPPTPPPTCSFSGSDGWVNTGCPVGYSGQHVFANDHYSCSDGSAYVINSVEKENSCTPPPSVPGCNIINATNYNPLATVYDGTCTFAVPGCTDPSATNYNPLATANDGTCTYPPPPPSSVPGCTNPSATNYNPLATVNNGTCTFAPPSTTCTVTTDSQYGAPTCSGLCANSGSSYPTCTPPAGVRGCPVPSAGNYNPAATSNDGSCTCANGASDWMTCTNFGPGVWLDSCSGWSGIPASGIAPWQQVQLNSVTFVWRLGGSATGCAKPAVEIWTDYCTGAPTWESRQTSNWGPDRLGGSGCVNYPPTVTAVCNAAGTEATLSWDAVPGVTSYRFRDSATSNATSCSGIWQFSSPYVCRIASYSGTSLTVTTVPGDNHNLRSNSLDSGTGLPGTDLWKAFTCLGPPPTGSITSTPDCVISNNNSTCTITANWTSNYFTSTRFVDNNTGTTLSTAQNGPLTNVYVAYGGTGFMLYNGATPVDYKMSNGDCLSSSAWNGTKCQACANGGCTNHVCNNTSTVAPLCSFPPTSGFIVSVPSCIISNGNSTCTITANWISSGLTTPRFVDQNTATDLSIDPAGPLTNVFVAYGGTTFGLYDGLTLLDSQTASGDCQSSSAWNGGTCEACAGLGCTNHICNNPALTAPACTTGPQVLSAIVTGEYYPNDPDAPLITVTCSAISTGYSVLEAGTGVVVIPPTVGFMSGQTYSFTPDFTRNSSYIVRCLIGSAYDQVVKTYHYAPSAADKNISFDVTPRTLNTGDKVTLSWNTKFPTNACTLTGKVICANNACGPAQQAFQTSLNNTLLNGLTELLPGTSRLVPLAVSKIAPGYGSPVWRALGKKILTLKYSTEFTYDCGNGLKVVRRALVSKSSEQ